MSVTYNPKIVTDGLQLYLDAANIKSYPGSGNTWYNLKGGNNAVLENGTTNWNNSGEYNKGSFLTTSSNFRTSNSFGGLPIFTVEAFFKPVSVINTVACIVSDFFPNFVNFKLGYNGSNALNGGIYGPWEYTTASITPQLNTWTSAVITLDSNKLFSLYSDGVLIGTPNTVSYVPTSSNLGILIGRRWALADYFDGYISIVRIYNRALSAAEVLQNYNALKGRFGL